MSEGRWSRIPDRPEDFSFELVLGGVIKALFGVLAVTLLCSAIVYFTNLDERILGWAVNVGSFLILGLSSFHTARRTESNGFLYGLSIGGVYAVVTFFFGTLVFPPFAGFSVFLRRLGFALISGACGGILGVNT